MVFPEGPRLLVSLGSVNVSFALQGSPNEFASVTTLPRASFADLTGAIRAFLMPQGDIGVRHASVAVSCPVEGDWVQVTNIDWQFSIEAVRIDIGLDTLVVVNDFTALAAGIPMLSKAQRRQVGGGEIQEHKVVGVLGAGSGLGVSGLIPAEGDWISLASEGGHADFAPQDQREIEILKYAQTKYPHVSAERILAGPGLVLCYEALAQFRGQSAEPLQATDISARGLAGSCSLCAETLEVFCSVMGAFAANLAVTLGAFGGIYIGGNIVPRLGAYFDQSPFRRRFESKGRFSDYLKRIPTYVITGDDVGFIGIGAVLDVQLRQRRASSSILNQIRIILPDLTPAERRVADLVRARPRSVLSDPIINIARNASVSQPTVIRFCRSLGCAGLSDFRLRLASGLTGTIPVSHTRVTYSDSTLELGTKVLGNTAAAILHFRDQLNRKAIERATNLLLAARRIEFYPIGEHSYLVEDAIHNFLRLGISVTALPSRRLQLLSARLLSADDVVIVAATNDHLDESLSAIDAVLERGAKVIALTSSQSALVKRATVAINIDYAEDDTTQLPMISRILFLLVIDILAVGVAMQKHPDALLSDAAMATEESHINMPLAL